MKAYESKYMQIVFWLFLELWLNDQGDDQGGGRQGDGNGSGGGDGWGKRLGWKMGRNTCGEAEVISSCHLYHYKADFKVNDLTLQITFHSQKTHLQGEIRNIRI